MDLYFFVLTDYFLDYSRNSSQQRKPKVSKGKSIKGGVSAATGYLSTGVRAGIKASGEQDLALLLSTSNCTAAGMFTTNRVRATCVERCASILPSTTVRAIFCNSGNANACTGELGAKDNETIARTVADSVGDFGADSVLTASTGVIGQSLPMQKVIDGIGCAITSLKKSSGNEFARAILTTDTRTKEHALRVSYDGSSFVVGGSAKGSGMICPNMATMLCFVTTDADVTASALDKIVKRVVKRTFNNLTVDGDTSTNDMVLVLANGQSGVKIRNSQELSLFEDTLFEVCNDLCAKIAEDGEGATKRIEIHVRGGKTAGDAQKAACAIANSNLVKTAVFGNDPNWGRILCAIGYSGADFSQTNMKVALCGVPVCRGTTPVDFSASELSKLLGRKLVTIDVDLALGNHDAIAHTCDLTYDYIKINAEYHT